MQHHTPLSPDEMSECIRLAFTGMNVRQILRATGIGAERLSQERRTNGAFQNAFLEALDCGYDIVADSLDNITEEYPDVAEARLISDNRKWTLARRKAKVYGDRLNVDIEHRIDISGALEEARRRSTAALEAVPVLATLIPPGSKPVAAWQAETDEPSLQTETGEPSQDALLKGPDAPPSDAASQTAGYHPKKPTRRIADLNAKSADSGSGDDQNGACPAPTTDIDPFS
jgi:hypothetical protein